MKEAAAGGKSLETYVIVRPEHLNHHGYLFGGQLLKWVDEFAWIGASKIYQGRSLVTRAMDTIEFKERVVNGSILRFHTFETRKGNTSVTWEVDVFADEPGGNEEKEVFSTSVTFVCLDAAGNKCGLDCEEHTGGCEDEST
ncbi:MAG: acyl-CoA thioesterase [Spirochaetales bacterium]|nr:acyl-CoA thioesterase [Spirochaetales bacterium]